MLYSYFKYYCQVYGEQVARRWLGDVLDVWYTEDLEVIKKYEGLNQFKLWKNG